MSERGRVPRIVVAANWKMHKGPEEARAFVRDFSVRGGSQRPRVLLFPPAVSLPAAVAACPTNIEVGIQNIHWEDEGAFTGEVSAAQARAAGATHALVGHSERRQLFGEKDADVVLKVSATLRNGLTPLLCVGETLEERRAGKVDEVILGQLDAVLVGLSERTPRLLLAYEPVWAIGTGETATPRDAADAHGTLRERMRERMGALADSVPILYGGSVKPKNAAELMAASNVDGVLVGGASLDPGALARIVEAAPDR